MIMAFWLFQANPEIYTIDDAIWDLNLQADGDWWTVKQFQEQVRLGDIVVVWRAGEEAGIVAMGLIKTNPMKGIEKHNPYWTKKGIAEDKRELELYVRVLYRPFEKPILRTELEADGIDLEIMRIPRRTNYRLAERDWKRLTDYPRFKELADSVRSELKWRTL